MSSLYTNSSFRDPKRQIRLLRLHTQKNDAEIVCSLEVHDFDDTCPKYVAISYTWGDVAPTVSIRVNNMTIRVRLLCWHALWQMQYHAKGQEITLWIDSVCINQDDNAEKNAQVAMMGRIYQSAASVASCLGPGNQLGEASAALRDERKENFSRTLELLEQMPYFDRIWIKQEIVLARELQLYCGLDSMPWQDVNEMLQPRSNPER